MTAVAASLLLASIVSTPSITIPLIPPAYAQSASIKEMYDNCEKPNCIPGHFTGGTDPTNYEDCYNKAKYTIILGVCFKNSHTLVVEEGWQCENDRAKSFDLWCIKGTPGCPPGQVLYQGLCAPVCKRPGQGGCLPPVLGGNAAGDENGQQPDEDGKDSDEANNGGKEPILFGLTRAELPGWGLRVGMGLGAGLATVSSGAVSTALGGYILGAAAVGATAPLVVGVVVLIGGGAAVGLVIGYLAYRYL